MQINLTIKLIFLEMLRLEMKNLCILIRHGEELQTEITVLLCFSVPFRHTNEEFMGPN